MLFHVALIARKYVNLNQNLCKLSWITSLQFLDQCLSQIFEIGNHIFEGAPLWSSLFLSNSSPNCLDTIFTWKPARQFLIDEFRTEEHFWWITTKYGMEYLIQGFWFKDILIFGVLASNRVAAKYCKGVSLIFPRAFLKVFSSGTVQSWLSWRWWVPLRDLPSGEEL